MECPQCKSHSLEPKEIEPGLLAAYCMNCQGCLLSLMNYRYWIDQQPELDKPEALKILVDDSRQAKTCPKCSHLMTKYQIGSQLINRLDLCGHCDEAWLDNGEWRLLKQLDLHGKLPAIFTDAWQRNIRLQRQQHARALRYENLLGKDDLNRVQAFKAWMDQHPHRDSISIYLNTKQS